MTFIEAVERKVEKLFVSIKIEYYKNEKDEYK
jgi:hypothetical protein